MIRRPLSTRVVVLCVLSVVAFLSLAPSLLSSSSECAAGVGSDLLLSVRAQILHEALTDVERAEARAEEEAAIHAGSLHRLGAAYKRVRDGRPLRSDRRRPHRSLPRAPPLVRIDPHSGEQEAFTPTTHKVRLPRRSSVSRSRVPEELLQRRRRQQQQRLAQQQMHRPQHGQQPDSTQQQHEGVDAPERQHDTQHADQRQDDEPQQHPREGQQQDQRSRSGRPRDSVSHNSTGLDPHGANSADVGSDPSASEGSLADAHAAAASRPSDSSDPTMIGRVGFSVGGGRLEDNPPPQPPADSDSKSYFGKGVISSLVDSRTLEPLAAPSRASATAGALVVLVPILGLLAFYAAYSCMEMRRRSAAMSARAAAAHDAIINSSGRAGARAKAAASAAGSSAVKVNPSQSHSSALSNDAAAAATAARVRRAAGDDDFDAEWEGPMDDGL